MERITILNDTVLRAFCLQLSPVDGWHGHIRSSSSTHHVLELFPKRTDTLTAWGCPSVVPHKRGREYIRPCTSEIHVDLNRHVCEGHCKIHGRRDFHKGELINVLWGMREAAKLPYTRSPLQEFEEQEHEGEGREEGRQEGVPPEMSVMMDALSRRVLSWMEDAQL
jgi:hypothetical protein